MYYLVLIVIAAVILVAVVIRRLPYLRTHRLGMEISRPRPYGRPSPLADWWYSLKTKLLGIKNRGLPSLNQPMPTLHIGSQERDRRKVSPLDRTVPVQHNSVGVQPGQMNHDNDVASIAHPEDFWQEELYQPSALEMPAQGLITRRGEAQKIAQELITHADAAFTKKDYKDAEKFYLQAATKDPNNARIYNRLGVIYLNTKNYRDAIEAFRGALKFDDRVASRHFNLALAYFGKRDYRSAEKVLREAIKLDPTNDKYRKTLESVQK